MGGDDKKLGGTGVSPVQSFKITRRTLPHWQDPERVYFITWRCKKGEVLSPEERTIGCNLGLALDDMATAPIVYRRAVEKGMGTWLPL